MSESKTLIPSKVRDLPPHIHHEVIMAELTAAHSAVGELRGLLRAIPNPAILIAPFRKREAVASSAIEGTRATLEEVLKYEASDKKEMSQEDEKMNRKLQDIYEVMNYEHAMSAALEELQERPIGENLLKKTHKILLDSVRGTNKDRGNFRRVQVAVGDYVPPVHTEISSLIANWEKYLNSVQEPDPLVRIGVAHYQFEAIHPFLDGNGRIGRLVIPLFLCQTNELQTPVLYISHHLEKHRTEYQRLLHAVDTDQDWIPWIKFFLTAVEAQAKVTANMVTEIQALYEKLKVDVVGKIRSQHAITLLDLIFKKTIISANDAQQVLNAKSKGTTYNLLEKFVAAGVLREVKSYGRGYSYVFSDLLRILKI